jgi:hypothetical protein
MEGSGFASYDVVTLTRFGGVRQIATGGFSMLADPAELPLPHLWRAKKMQPSTESDPLPPLLTTPLRALLKCPSPARERAGLYQSARGETY